MTLTFRQTPETFRVDEELFFEPSGSGEHLFVQIEKTGISTAQAKAILEAQTGLSVASMKHAGLKDKQATCTQWISLPTHHSLEIDHPNLRILRQSFHEHSIGLGHVRWNHFHLKLNGEWTAPGTSDRQVFPNFFGAQRFGCWAPVDLPTWVRRSRGDVFSRVQSYLFNEYLRFRIASHGRKPIPGDIFGFPQSKKTFVSNHADDMLRCEQGEIIPTGPIFGAKMPVPDHQLEVDFLADQHLTWKDLKKPGKRGKGARRLLWVEAVNFRYEASAQELVFSLRSGSYATVLLLHLFMPTILTCPFWEWPDFTDGVVLRE